MSDTEDLSSKLSELLSDKDGMDKIKQMAESLMGGEKSAESAPSADSPLGDLGIDPAMLLKVFSALKPHPDDRTGLLMALKPHLSDERQHKVDTAVKLLRLTALLPLLREQHLFDF